MASEALTVFAIVAIGAVIVRQVAVVLRSDGRTGHRQKLLLLLAVALLASALCVTAALQPSQGIRAVIGIGLVALGGYVLYRARQAPPRSAATPRPETPSRFGQRLVAGLLAASAALLVIAGTAQLVDDAGEAAVPPPTGSIIDAANGELVKKLHTRTTHQPVQIAGGSMFRVCNLSRETPCDYEPGRLVKAGPGDVLKFKLRLHNPWHAPLPYAELYVQEWSSSEADIRVELYIEMTERGGAMGAAGPRPSPADIDLPGPQPHSDGLAYIPGSTRLWDAESRFLGHLPDGIMESGIALANIGAPASCYACDIDYVRFVSFQARVTRVH